MDRWVDGWMGQWIDGWMGEWMDGWMDGFQGRYIHIIVKRGVWVGKALRG